MLLPDETYERAQQQHERAARALRAFRACDTFLHAHNIRPEFFCRYREKMLLQQALQAVETSVSGSMASVRASREASGAASAAASGAASAEDSTRSGGKRHKRRKPHKQTSVREDASSSNEAVHLQQRLLSLSSELVTLRNHLHVGGPGALAPQPPTAAPPAPPVQPPPGKLAHPPATKVPAPLPQASPGSGGGGGGGAQPAVPPRSVPAPPAPVPAPPAPAPPLTNAVNYPQDVARRWRGGGGNGGGSGGAGADLDDLIHLRGPLTEDAVVKTLHARFYANKFYTNVGPILVALNAYTDTSNPLTLAAARAGGRPELARLVHDAVRQQADTGYPQAIILSGTSGSGKTYASMLLLRRLFDVAGGGPETDAFKHLAAAFTVLRSLGSASTAANSHSSRIGHFIEVQVTDGALYRTKIHCYFLDQTRVIRPLPHEKNYHIFYQMLAGLSHEERVKLHLDGYGPLNLRYLQFGDTRQNEAEDAARFQAWKVCLGILGIPFLDVVRVLAAVLLLGNVQFSESGTHEPAVEVKGEAELNSAAALLGVSSAALFRGLGSRTRTLRGQTMRTTCDADACAAARDALAKALYCRTVATIVRRANSLKRLGSTLGTLSSDSNESVHNQGDAASRRASTIGGGSNAGSKSMAALNNAVRHATDGFVGILDMFGFEDAGPSRLEHLCINLCAETMQHFYNTHIFKSSIESCREEGIGCDLEVDYVDNVPCIDLVSSLRAGLLALLDADCAARGTPESYVARVRAQHRHNDRLFEPRPPDARRFGVRHYAGDVVYDASDFIDANRDVVPDDLVAAFHRRGCDFGFATHLFGGELKTLFAGGAAPRGASFRASPTSHAEALDGDEPSSSLTQDFHTRLDNLLRTLVHARPHFVRCVRANRDETPMLFERATVARQIRALQTLETVNLMAGGYPHRMRFRAFASRYRALGPRTAERDTAEACSTVLRAVDAGVGGERCGGASVRWALGKRHVFLSEGMRQILERARRGRRRAAAECIQAAWRRHRARAPARAAPAPHLSTPAQPRPRPAPIAGTPPPDPADKCDPALVRQTCTLFGLDLERPPPLPPSRAYTVAGGVKLGYPQTRVMKLNWPEVGEAVLRAGESVLVVGAGRRGHLMVEVSPGGQHVQVPYRLLQPPRARPAPPAPPATAPLPPTTPSIAPSLPILIA